MYTLVNTSKATGTIKYFKDIPGPSSLPILGPLHNFLPGGGLYNLNRSEMFNELYRRYGPIVRLDKLANQPNTVFLFDANSIGIISRGEESSPRRSLVGTLESYRQKFNKQDHIGVIINGTGAEWKNFRRIANKAMLNPKVIQASYSEIIDEIAREAVDRFKSIRNEMSMISNFNEELKLWALETTTALTLGQRLHCFTGNLSEDSHEKRLISLIQDTFEIVENIDFQHNIFQKFFFLQNKKVLDTYKELERVILHFLDKSLAIWKSKEKKEIDNDIHACIVEKVFNTNKKVALGLAIDSMIAGIDAVSQAIMFLLYLLGSHPEEQRKLREEVLSEKGQKPYLRACVKESLRVIPTAIANTRITTKSYEVLGYEIPEQTLIVVPQQIMSTMESHYPRATEFIPERWLVGKEHPLYYGNAHPFTYMPFGVGIRTCLGRRLAVVMIEKLITNVFKKFEVSWEGPPPKITLSSFNKMEKPFRFVFKSI